MSSPGGRRFPPGVSGNPRGRPRKPKVECEAPAAAEPRPAVALPVLGPPTATEGVPDPARLTRTSTVARMVERARKAAARSEATIEAPAVPATVEVIEAEELPDTRHAGRPKPYEARGLEPYRPPRDEGGRFKPGTSGNPLGRPLGALRYLADQTADGQEVIDHALNMMRGKVYVRWEEEVADENGIVRSVERGRWMPADPKHQAEAREWVHQRIADLMVTRGAGALRDPEPDFDSLSFEEARELLRLLNKAEAPRALPAPPDE